MSDFSAFLKQNKKERENVKYVSSKDFVDENGKPVEWEVRPLKSKEMDTLRETCTTYGKKGKTSFDTWKFNRMVAARATVFPDLNLVELQNSYGVKCAEDLIQELLDNDGEYMSYINKINEISGYNETEDDLVDEVKN